ncbi:MAG TPA: hypothetical protein VK977_00600, partial [Actinomycetota bacterium]|nr:hypothetical protein [Actinomycetota bacterium]
MMLRAHPGGGILAARAALCLMVAWSVLAATTPASIAGDAPSPAPFGHPLDPTLASRLEAALIEAVETQGLPGAQAAV